MHKMASVEKFIYLDDVQFVMPSFITRNKVLDSKGNEFYFVAHIKREGHLEKKINEVSLTYDRKWNTKLIKFFYLNYKKAPFFDETISGIEKILTKGEMSLMKLDISTINWYREVLDIQTPFCLQSEINYNSFLKSTNLLLELTKKVGGNTFFSGNGARRYMEDLLFYEAGIDLEYQNFSQPKYKQFNSEEFIPYTSLLDMFFNIGFTKSKEIFWNTVRKKEGYPCNSET